MYLNYTYVVLWLIAQASNHIPNDDPNVAGKLRGYTLENWNRGLILAKFYIHESGISHVKTVAKGHLTLSIKDIITNLKFLIDMDFAIILEDLVDSTKYNKDWYNFFCAC